MEWTSVKVITTKESVEAVSNIFMDLNSGGVLIDDPETLANYAESDKWDAHDFVGEEIRKQDFSVTGYLPIDAAFPEKIQILTERLEELKGIFPDYSYSIEKEKVFEEDWANSWKKYFKVLKMGERTIIKPSWEEYAKKDDEIIIDIDPGMAFGTGNHATTSLCLKILERYVKKGHVVVDVGAGSGILSIQAALLGAQKVYSYDYDNVAVESARTNIAKNKLETIVESNQNDLLTGIDKVGDIVVANIVADIIVRLIPQVENNIKKGGIFVVSGIIEKRKEEIHNMLEEYGYKILEVNEEEEWYAFVTEKI